MVKNLPAMQETHVQSLGREDPLEKGMATHFSSCLENSMDRGSWQAIQSMGSQRVVINTFTYATSYGLNVSHIHSLIHTFTYPTAL